MGAPPKILIFDCDSTLSAIEGIDELARVRGPEIFAQVEAMKAALAAANKRIVNILRKSGAEAAPAVARGRLADGAEHDLYLAFQQLAPQVDAYYTGGNFADYVEQVRHARFAVALVPRGASIDAVALPLVHRDVRRGVAGAALLDEVARVIAAVGGQRDGAEAGHGLVEHVQRGRARRALAQIANHI